MTPGTAATPTRGGIAPYGDWIGRGSDGRADPDHEPPRPTSATPAGTGRISSHLLPYFVGAMLTAPAFSVRRLVWTSASTPIEHIHLNYSQDRWEPALELITDDQVRALNALLTIPYNNDHGFDYFADE